MPTIKLTQVAADKLRPPAEGNLTYWDNQCPGFGVRISSRGRRTWVAMYRVNGKSVMETISTMAVMPSVAEARQRARESMTAARGGANPVEKRREVEAEEKTKAEADGFTFRKAAERFLREHIERNSAPKYAAEVRRILEHDVLPRWGEKPIRTITKRDVNELIDAKANSRERDRKGYSDGATVQANRTLTRLRTLFGWAAAKDLVDADPTAGVRTRVNEKSRVRALVTVDGEGDINGEEIERFWFGCEGLGWPFGPLFKLLLLTGQRREEVGGMRWSELNLEKRIWTIPAERAKSDRVHIVHLSDLAIEVIESIPRTGDLVFSSTGSTPVSGYSRAKERIDSLMTKQVRERTGNPDARIADWILHDLRRTAATGMAGLEIAPHVVDKILNHSAIIRGIALIYNKHEYEKERRAALEAWGRYIEALVRDVPSNVADIAEARARR